jgi:hypothetical protein
MENSRAKGVPRPDKQSGMGVKKYSFGPRFSLKAPDKYLIKAATCQSAPDRKMIETVTGLKGS